jgi:glucarate dehydratase
MKISKVTAIPVNIPYRIPSVMSAGTSGYSTRTVVIVETDSGIAGLGEASYAGPAHIIESDFAPSIVGLDALNRALVCRHCLPAVFDHGTPNVRTRLAAWGALEIALWDILGKVAKLPLYRLLGGAVRDRAPFAAYAYADESAANTVASLVHRAQEQIDLTGARIFEFKVGVHEVDIEIEAILAVHKVLRGRARIAVDANLGMSFGDARRLIGGVGMLLENFEEPVESFAHMQRLADEFRVSISTHCCDIEVLRQYPGIDGVVPTLDSVGGIDAVRRVAQVFRALGKRVWIRSHAEAGIGWAAIVHLGMSTVELERPAQSLIDVLEDDLVVGDPWLVREGGVRPPERPGLGVTLDLGAVEKYHKLYEQLGEVQAFPAAACKQSAK